MKCWWSKWVLSTANNNDTIHLGHPVLLTYKNKTTAYNFILNKFRSKLTKLLEKVTTIISNFWWKGNQTEGTTKSICFRTWEDICQPKHLGGLGIKNITTMDQSPVTHSAWMIVALKDPFLSKVLVTSLLKAKYHPYSSFWKAQNTGARSVFWSSTQSVRHYIHENCTYKIHEGTVNIWSEPWCPIWDNIHSHLNMPSIVNSLPNQVKDLWNHNGQNWNIDLINQIFDNQATQVITNTPVVEHPAKELLIWKPIKKGECPTKEAYKFLTTPTSRINNLQGSRRMTAVDG
ncbi:hypothetical protein BS78_04G134000 [Paspalum vaginatum]|nr:hypothetical protein BS78_04G134000 [Paspalum vaginatum]